MSRLGLVGKTLTVVADIYRGSTIAIKTGKNSLTPDIPQQRGVKQGCPLSPLLFNIAMEGMLRHLATCPHGYRIGEGVNINHLAYADDVCILAGSRMQGQKLDAYRRFLFPRLSYVLKILFPGSSWCRRLDTGTRKWLKKAVSIPSRACSSFLYTPQALGGLGVPCIEDEMHITRVAQSVKFLGLRVHSFFLGHSRYVYYTFINVSRLHNFVTYRHTPAYAREMKTKTIRGSVWLSTRLLGVSVRAWSKQHCGRPRPTWQLESFMKKGGIVQIRFVCPHCKVAGTWASSRVLAGNYLASQKQVAMLMYCTTSSTKNVAKEMKKICAGPVKARDKTWFAQLSDKARSTKHFQGHHLNCHLESRCRQPGYHPKRKILTMCEAIKAYEDALKRTLIYCFAGSFCRCRDTFWMESFNHQLLTYLPKRIHFHTNTFKMRMNLAVMDWNENTQRASISHDEYLDVRRPDHHSTYNVLKKKTFQFVRNIWNAYILKNISSLHPFEEEDDAFDVTQ
ncbi:hypothetical protein EMCRGX_G005436 [Ephydatia muelleri]